MENFYWRKLCCVEVPLRGFYSGVELVLSSFYAYLNCYFWHLSCSYLVCIVYVCFLNVSTICIVFVASCDCLVSFFSSPYIILFT